MYDGIIYCNVVEGLFYTKTFFNFIQGLLMKMQQFLALNSVLVMNNCKIHKHPNIQRIIETRYVVQ